MPLIFPNMSRSFDETKQTVRFHGYDGMFEVRFVVEATALLKRGEAHGEADCLSAFDRMRSAIQTAAAKLYARKRQTIYTVTAADLG